MAEELLDRIRREIADRMAQSRSAYEESVRLEAALVALDATRDAEQSGQRRRSGGRAAASRPRRRAPRGENRRRILEAVEQNPSASARDIATATGIARPTVATTLAKLVRDGELAKLSAGAQMARDTGLSRGLRRQTGPALQFAETDSLRGWLALLTLIATR